MNARAALVTSRPGAALYARALAVLPPSLVGLEARVSALAVFPVKGLGAVRIARARVQHHGLVDPASGLADRGVIIAVRQPGETPDGGVYDALGLANRNEATLALARTVFQDGALVYDAPGLAPLALAPSSIAPASEGERIRVKLPYPGGPVLEGIVDDGPLAAWVRDLLHAHPARRRYDPRDVVAIRPADNHRRSVAERHLAGQDAQTLFGDGAHALVTSASTLAWMNDALVAQGLRPIEMEAFRPNIVLGGLPPNAEDLIREVHVDAEGGLVRLLFSSLCVRCDATRVDYATGTRPDTQPLAWLARNRPPRDGDANAATFGINAVFPRAADGRVLHVGDVVRIASERD
jgi:MOSC domain-containing protein